MFHFEAVNENHGQVPEPNIKHSFQQILNDVRIARNAKPCWRLSVENIGQIVENQKDKEGCN